MTEYVLGFAFDTTKKMVVLIEKQHPKWQVGLHNGVGGHKEEGEDFNAAMRREFSEETSVDIPQWEPYAKLCGPDWYVRCFRTFTDDVLKAVTITDERVSLFPVKHLNILSLVPNLAYLIPLALDSEPTGWTTFNYGQGQ